MLVYVTILARLIHQISVNTVQVLLDAVQKCIINAQTLT